MWREKSSADIDRVCPSVYTGHRRHRNGHSFTHLTDRSTIYTNLTDAPEATCTKMQQQRSCSFASDRWKAAAAARLHGHQSNAASASTKNPHTNLSNPQTHRYDEERPLAIPSCSFPTHPEGRRRELAHRLEQREREPPLLLSSTELTP